MSKSISTLIGIAAILTWAFLALLSTAAGSIPPFQLAAMTFFLGGMVGISSWVFRPHALKSLRQPWQVWALGVSGLCIYHCAYFFAIQSAPPVEVSLIAYLWPLLIVVFASFLPGERLRVHHIAGVILGLIGAVVIITKGGSVGLAGGIMPGHLIALFCAFIWSGYSVLSRRFGQVPVDVVAGYCLITSLVAFLLHLGLEQTVWPQSATQWAAIAVLGTFRSVLVSMRGTGAASTVTSWSSGHCHMPHRSCRSSSCCCSVTVSFTGRWRWLAGSSWQARSSPRRT
jgi:drug/metabolite transporter (DMT)-like permease